MSNMSNITDADSTVNDTDFPLCDRILAADAAMEVVEVTGNVQTAKDHILERAFEEHICTRWWLWSYLFLVTEGKA